jgi:DNA-binding MarR family transcriptional regulator
LTKEELIFLHLLNYQNHRDHYVVPELITEKGIQSVVDCDLSLISRLLKKNEKRGYIYRTLSKVESKKRKQNAFFLTEEGIKIALELTKLNSNEKQ